MQFKKVKNKIQCLRNEYVPAERDENGNLVRGTGRAKNKMIGSFPSFADDIKHISSDLLSALTTDELDQLNEYLNQKKNNNAEIDRKFATENILHYLNSLLETSSPGDYVSDDDKKKISEKWGKLARRLREKPKS